MKSSDLRIGNFAAVCYEDIFIPDQVIILEPGVVHLSKRIYPDSDRDIVGVPLQEDWLRKFHFNYNSIFDSWEFKDILIKKLPNESENCWMLQSNSGHLKISFVHELQNLLHVLAKSN
ncbi:MAG: hypothetical protein M3Z26_06525 [Bacteroidota bacterium]|nr:hypothetical protein [Bacteroidota bacterium]